MLRGKTKDPVAQRLQLAGIAETTNRQVGMGKMVFPRQGVEFRQFKFGLQFVDQGLIKRKGEMEIGGAIGARPYFRFGLNNHFKDRFRRSVEQGHQFMQLGNDKGQSGQAGKNDTGTGNGNRPPIVVCNSF